MKPAAAFTLAEMLISMAASVIIIGALLVGSTGLHRALHASELYAASCSDQRRLIDFVARDLRRAIGIAATDAGGTLREVAGQTIEISERESLIVTLPGYYKSNAPSDGDFDQALPVVPSSNGSTYGTGGGPAPTVPVVFRRMFVAEEGSVCFVREEAGARAVVVRHSEDFHLRVAVAPDGRRGVIEGWFESSFGAARPGVPTRDEVMLRNLRIDSPR